MKKTAEGFFSDTAEDFDAGYAKSAAFKERYNVWTSLWSRYFPTSGKILDLGCGSGVFSFALASKGFDVTGIDGAENMIQICKKKNDLLKLSNVHFIQTKIPFEKNLFNDKFEIVISSSVLEYIEDIDIVLTEISLLMQPNGILMISMPNSKALYRNLERLSWHIIRKPQYLKYVHNIVNKDEFNRKINGFGFTLMHSQFYGKQYKISEILPESIGSTLFVSIFKKTNSHLID
jgi:2-polyprenyl-3-methyl-5-hydroxy-6-metoxy-1,4-benzoquinol methylase